MTTVQIPDEIAHRYEDRARAGGYDLETLIREALVAQLEDLEDVELALHRLNHPQPALSLQDVKKSLGLDD